MTLYLSRYVERVRLNTKIDTQVLTHLLTHVDSLTACISACERLLRTPIPLGYNICISRILWIFIFALPTQLWRELRWWTIAVTMVTAYALFALAEVGLEIENVSKHGRIRVIARKLTQWV
jgi:putative membrane protein